MTSINPLLSKVKLPGRVFQLPSKGLFYEPGILKDTVKDGEIQVKPMSALAELKVRSADLLISTKIIREICEECIPEILQPEKLLSADVDAIFLFLIASTYGNEKIIKSIHDCDNAKLHDYSINLEPILSNPNNSQLAHRDISYYVKLDNDQHVFLKPPTFLDAVDIVMLRNMIDQKTANGESITSVDLSEIMVKDLLAVIKSVSADSDPNNLVTDKKFIEEWIRTISKNYMERISDTAMKASEWGFNFDVKLKCKDCGSEYTHQMELNPVNFLLG